MILYQLKNHRFDLQNYVVNLSSTHNVPVKCISSGFRNRFHAEHHTVSLFKEIVAINYQEKQVAKVIYRHTS
jgi:hypothetical protein